MCRLAKPIDASVAIAAANTQVAHRTPDKVRIEQIFGR
jgi:hypothetical protein